MVRPAVSLKFRELPDATSRVVEALKAVGPENCSLISRMTGVPIETVRYKIKRQLPSKGFRFHVGVDYDRLDLTRYWLTLDFTSAYRDMAVQILDALAEVGYLIFYARLTPRGTFVAIVALPSEARRKYSGFLDHLTELGILTTYTMEELAWAQYLSLNPKNYDFSSQTWTVDWPSLQRTPVSFGATEQPSEPSKIDKLDLHILKELQLDSTQTFAAIAKKLNINPKTIRYHYSRHIVGQRLISRYLVRWMGDIESTKRHSLLNLKMWFRNLTSTELKTARATILRLPFTWSEMLATDGKLYVAEVHVPLQLYPDTLEFLRKSMADFSSKMDYGVTDYSASSVHTIPYKMYEDETGWRFDLDDLKNRFRNLSTVVSP